MPQQVTLSSENIVHKNIAGDDIIQKLDIAIGFIKNWYKAGNKKTWCIVKLLRTSSSNILMKKETGKHIQNNQLR